MIDINVKVLISITFLVIVLIIAMYADTKKRR